jgi:hypothetical protein
MPNLAGRRGRSALGRACRRHPHVGRLVAVPASEATEGVVYRIEKIEARPAEGMRKVIAILDDDEDLTNSICAHFDASGYDARPFYKLPTCLRVPRRRSTTGM